ncbi:uncharacterized protein [Typha angustifolia]|uniref:uncharacterized protein isoform X1 n=1 Tax=Typha angustifolia TaxID=59011 RepID=UPI003C2EFFEE
MGGGTMRTAAKAVAGYRSGSPFSGHASVGGRRFSAAAPSTATVGWKEKDALESANPAPRVVFGSVPTIEEAKEAISDLQGALEKVYFSKTTTEVSRRHAKGIGSESISQSMPRHVFQAFSLLQGSTEAQNVVASLTADRNVWDAVMKNDKVMEFYRDHQLASIESVSENALRMGSSVTFEDPSADTSLISLVADFVNNIKKNVMELVSNVSNFFQDFLGNLAGDHSGIQSRTRNSTSDSHVAVGASFVALVVASILVVLVKRG